MENLILLCSRHHHLVHEGGFGLLKLASGEVQFSNQNGNLIPNSSCGRSRGGCVKTIWWSPFLGQHLTNETSICLSEYDNPTSSSETKKYRE